MCSNYTLKSEKLIKIEKHMKNGIIFNFADIFKNVENLQNSPISNRFSKSTTIGSCKKNNTFDENV